MTARLRRLLPPAARLLMVVAGLLLAYAFAPVQRDATFAVGTALLFVVGLLVLAGSVILVARKELHADESEPGPHVEGLVALLLTIVIFFALIYLRIAQRPNQFAELHTRVDALYFTMATLTTVGYGDVHPVGQAARMAVTCQLAFDVVFVAIVLRVFSSSLQRRRRRNADPAAGRSSMT